MIFPKNIRLNLLYAVSVYAYTVSGHEHHEDQIPDGAKVSEDPIDAILWVHIFLQTFAFGILFPTGMVFGLIKSRWHVPTQLVGTVCAFVGYILGHMHKGRQFVAFNAHSIFASPLNLMLISQVSMGAYLKLHWETGIHGRMRKVVRPVHSFVGKAFPIASWTQIVFGVITSLGFCQDDHTGQCVAHFIMGSAFIGYGIILTIFLLVGQSWLRARKKSPEFYDSLTITAWGFVNTFTEHRWGSEWAGNDKQHTTMGLVWFCAGLVGLWLSSDRDGNPQRNFIPGFVLLITGWAMSSHPQELMISAMTHTMFGYTLMAAGLTRIIEISFILRDEIGLSADGRSISSFQYIPVFLLYMAGVMFMSATHEQMELLASVGIDHVAWILILISMASILFLFVNTLIHVYTRAVYPRNSGTIAIESPIESTCSRENTIFSSRRQQYPKFYRPQKTHDAQEFELDGLVSDDSDSTSDAHDETAAPNQYDISTKSEGSTFR